MNILIISPGILPVPAVNGGAVENLIEIFLEENEKCQNVKKRIEIRRKRFNEKKRS